MDDVVRTIDQSNSDMDMIVQLQNSLHSLVSYINGHATLQEMFVVQGYLSSFIGERLCED